MSIPASVRPARRTDRLGGQARFIEGQPCLRNLRERGLGHFDFVRQSTAGAVEEQVLEAGELLGLGRIARQSPDVAKRGGRVELVYAVLVARPKQMVPICFEK